MNAMNKIAAVAFAAALTTISTGFASETRVVRIDHGRASTYASMPVEKSPSIAVYAGGRSVGYSTAGESSDSGPRKGHIPMGRGQTLCTAAR